MNDLLKVYKDYKKVFNYIRPSEVEDFSDIVEIYQKMTKVLEQNNIIKSNGRYYIVIKTGEII